VPMSGEMALFFLRERYSYGCVLSPSRGYQQTTYREFIPSRSRSRSFSRSLCFTLPFSLSHTCVPNCLRISVAPPCLSQSGLTLISLFRTLSNKNKQGSMRTHGLHSLISSLEPFTITEPRPTSASAGQWCMNFPPLHLRPPQGSVHGCDNLILPREDMYTQSHTALPGVRVHVCVRALASLSLSLSRLNSPSLSHTDALACARFCVRAQACASWVAALAASRRGVCSESS